MSRETRDFQFQVKALGIRKNDDGAEFGQIEAYGAVFNNVDEGNDRIIPGAFKRTIKNSKERAVAREKRYMLPLLWQHDTNEIIGGWHELTEDAYGLKCKGDVALATQRGREYYELARAGMSDQFSIVYDIPQGGSHYDKSGVRELSELRLFSIDVVTFAMNEDTYLVGVKSMDYKAVCGNTSGPIGPRDESWSGSAAEKWIWGKAEKDDGSISASIAKKYFMNCDGDGSKKGDYGYPFWINDHISVGAVKAIAGAISGARGANAPDGMKAKVEKLYRRINAKYPDADELIPPWKGDDGKASRQVRQLKTLIEHYNEEMAEDLLEDWQDVYVCALTGAILDAFTIGDQPEADIAEALDAFKELVLSKFVAQASECDLSGYLEERNISYSPADYTLQYGSESKPNYGWMSRRARLARKAMYAGDATTGGFTADHVDKLHGAAKKALAQVQKHVDGIHDAADHIEEMVSGGEGDEIAQKAGRAFSGANTATILAHAGNLRNLADGHEKAMNRYMKTVNSAADDLATIIQGSERAYGTDRGTPEDGQQEGKARSSRQTPGTAPRSSSLDTVAEDDIAAALLRLHAIKV